MKKYKLGLFGEIISESSINYITENDGFDFAAAKSAPAKSTSTESGKRAESTKTATSSILDKGNLRIFEHIVYSTILTTVEKTFSATTRDGFNKVKDIIYPSDVTANPLSKYEDYFYWYKPTANYFFGPSASFKTNIENQEGFLFDKKWLPMIMKFDQIAWYKTNKDSEEVKKIFESVYKTLDTIREKMYNPQWWSTEIQYVSKKLLKYPDEVAEYITYMSGDQSKNTINGQLTESSAGYPVINGKYTKASSYSNILSNSSFTINKIFLNKTTNEIDRVYGK